MCLNVFDKVTVEQSFRYHIQYKIQSGLDMMREILIGVPDGEESFG